MEPKRRRELMLLALVVFLGGALYVGMMGWPWRSTDTSAGAASPSNPKGRAARNDRTAPGAAEAPDVHLEALEAAHPKPGDGRDLFRFKPKAPPPRPAAAAPARPVDPVPVIPAGPPPP